MSLLDLAEWATALHFVSAVQLPHRVGREPVLERRNQKVVPVPVWRLKPGKELIVERWAGMLDIGSPVLMIPS